MGQELVVIGPGRVNNALRKKWAYKKLFNPETKLIMDGTKKVSDTAASASHITYLSHDPSALDGEQKTQHYQHTEPDHGWKTIVLDGTYDYTHGH